MYVEILGQVLAGLGLFFVGIKLLSTSMQQMASPKLRQLIARGTSNPLVASVLGAVGGFLMQKPSGVIAILTSMQAGGLITLRQAMPIVAWCNVGLAALAFFVVIPISVFICYVIGVSGFLVMFAKKKKSTILVTAIFGAALLFFGLEQMKTGTGALRQFDWFQQFMLYSNKSTIIALIVGALVAAVTQSFIAIAIMAVALVDTGTLGSPQAMMIIYGANVGVGFFRRLMTASMTGETKQLFLYQNFFRYAGTGGSVLLFYAARIDGTPLMLYLAQLVSGSVGTQMALIFLACNLPAVVLATLLQERFARLLERLSPPTPDDDLTKLRHLSMASRGDTQDMLEKIDAELCARARKLVDYSEAARRGGKPKTAPESLHHSIEIVFGEISAFENELMRLRLPHEETQRLSVLMNIQTLLRMLDDSLFQMTCLVRDKINKSSSPLREPVGNLVEVSEALMMSLSDAMMSRDVVDMDTLDKLTLDKGSIMKDFRKRHLDSLEATDAKDKSVLIDLTNHYEHIVWIINRLASLLKR